MKTVKLIFALIVILCSVFGILSTKEPRPVANQTSSNS